MVVMVVVLVVVVVVLVVGVVVDVVLVVVELLLVVGAPQTFGVPLPPQVSGRVHVPQSRVPPQPSAIIPQFAPSAAHEVVAEQHVPNDFLLDLAHAPLQRL
jgi:hypothetical protein